jgi:hypothetical protein
MSLLERIHLLGSDERGAVLVIVAAFAPVAVLLAAFAIDASNWFLHSRHLQVQADAGALATAQSFQESFANGVNPTSTTCNAPIYEAARAYGGVTSATTPQGTISAATPLYNTQIEGRPGDHTAVASPQRVKELINSKTFYNQPSKVDSTAEEKPPCEAGMVDVKLTETELPWYMRPFTGVVDAHARLQILGDSVTSGAEPFAEPLPTPNTMTATLIDETNGDATIAGPITLTPSGDHRSWTTSSSVPVTFNDAKATGTIAVGLRIAMTGGSTATCGAGGVSCYQNDTEKHGVTFTRAWTNTGTPGQPTEKPVAPQTNDVTVAAGGSSPCPAGPGGTFSNFVSSSASCTVVVSASNVVFATGAGAPSITCATASLSVNGTAIPCPSGSPLNGSTWTSSAITVAPNSGLNTLTLGWSLKAGKLPVGASGGNKGACSEKNPCTGTLAVQRVNSGAYSSQSAEADEKTSGPILGATLTGPGGGAIMSVARGTSESVNVNVNVLGFENSTSIPSEPTELSFGGNQANGALECGGSAGSPQLQEALAQGCPETYGTTAAPAATACSVEQKPPVCAKQNPGNGKLDKDLDPGINKRINEGKNKCVNPNRWAAPNTVAQIMGQHPADPRIIITIITDNGALSNGTNKVPVRAFATFYVTGWAGDPCFSQANGSSNGLAYTKDDKPEGENSGVLLGHFIKYISIVGKETGSGRCEAQSISRCVAVLTR